MLLSRVGSSRLNFFFYPQYIKINTQQCFFSHQKIKATHTKQSNIAPGLGLIKNPTTIYKSSYPSLLASNSSFISKGLTSVVRYELSEHKKKVKDEKKSKNQQEHKKQQRQQQRIKKLKQIQKEQLKAMDDKINLTKGTYNSFVSYFLLYQGIIIAAATFIFVAALAFKIWTIGGFYPVQELQENKDKTNVSQNRIKTNKKFSIFSKQYEEKHMSQHLYRIFTDCYPVLQKQQVSPAMLSKSKRLTQSVQKLFNLTGLKLVILNVEQPIILSLPADHILISKSLLRSPMFSQTQLQFLIFLNLQLFKQGYHLRTLSITQLPGLWRLDSAASEIKLRQIYSRVYLKRQIEECMDILLQKLKISRKSPQEKQMRSALTVLQKYHKQGHNTNSKVYQQNIYQRLQKYYIMVKVE